MGAQVIMAVRHDMLHKITPQIIHGLSRMASINDLIPRHFESARIDDASRVTIGDGLDKQGVLCSHHSVRARIAARAVLYRCRLYSAVRMTPYSHTHITVKEYL